MIVTFVSNFLNHHQVPLSEAFLSMPGMEYHFVATSPIPEERLQMGYSDINQKYSYILCSYGNIRDKAAAIELIMQSDVVIYGDAPLYYIDRRVRKNKPTFFYAERPYKIPVNYKNYIKRAIGAWVRYGRYQGKKTYLLAASAYAPSDFSIFGNFVGKAYRWGYFPEIIRQDPELLMQRKENSKAVSILWAGRLLDWKHPEAALGVADALKAQGYDFHLDMIGSGPMEAQLRENVQSRNLNDCVSLLGAMSPEKVREYMEKADIFLFTSDFNEGWGAVLNESMNSGCAVVASHAIGSVPFLLKDGENGLIYESGNQEQLNRQVMWLIDHPKEREYLGRAACRTMEEQWNSEVAAKRFLTLVDHIRSGRPGSPFEGGPCSVAGLIANDWYSK